MYHVIYVALVYHINNTGNFIYRSALLAAGALAKVFPVNTEYFGISKRAALTNCSPCGINKVVCALNLKGR